MTIVGDVEQIVSLKGGLVSWEDAGIAIPPENINKLRINYRSSRQVFEFLKVYREVAGITEELVRPRLWYAGEGTRAKSAHAKIEMPRLQRLQNVFRSYKALGRNLRNGQLPSWFPTRCLPMW